MFCYLNTSRFTLYFSGHSVIKAINSILHPSTVQMEYNDRSKEKSENIVRCLQTLDEDDANNYLLDQRA